MQLKGATMKNQLSESARSNKATQNACRKPHDREAYPPALLEEFLLINRGYLPRADIMLPSSGCPAWSLATIATIFGVSRSELIQKIEEAGIRFDPIERTELL
jgi:AraC-like DNA-binding protein